MKKVNQPTDSVNTSGLAFGVDTSSPIVVTKQEEVPAVATVSVDVPVIEVEIKEEPIVVEEIKAKPKKAFRKKEVEDDDVVPMSTVNKASDSGD